MPAVAPMPRMLIMSVVHQSSAKLHNLTGQSGLS